MNAESVAASWRAASPAAVHPELDADGAPVSDGSAQGTVDELIYGIESYQSDATSILDYGGGPGRVARLIPPWYRPIVADTNPAFLKIAELAGLETLAVDPIPDRLPDVDVILCVNLFLHLPAEVGETLLGLFGRHADLIALQVPLYARSVAPATWTSVGTWTRAQLVEAAGRAGLDVLESHPNPGVYQPGKQPGPNHARLHFLRPRRIASPGFRPTRSSNPQTGP